MTATSTKPPISELLATVGVGDRARRRREAGRHCLIAMAVEAGLRDFWVAVANHLIDKVEELGPAVMTSFLANCPVADLRGPVADHVAAFVFKRLYEKSAVTAIVVNRWLKLVGVVAPHLGQDDLDALREAIPAWRQNFGRDGVFSEAIETALQAVEVSKPDNVVQLRSSAA